MLAHFSLSLHQSHFVPCITTQTFPPPPFINGFLTPDIRTRRQQYYQPSGHSPWVILCPELFRCLGSFYGPNYSAAPGHFPFHIFLRIKAPIYRNELFYSMYLVLYHFHGNYYTLSVAVEVHVKHQSTISPLSTSHLTTFPVSFLFLFIFWFSIAFTADNTAPLLLLHFIVVVHHALSASTTNYIIAFTLLNIGIAFQGFTVKVVFTIIDPAFFCFAFSCMALPQPPLHSFLSKYPPSWR